MVAGMGRAARLKHLGDDPERVLEAIESFFEREAVARELGLVPARAETQDEPTSADLVERLGHLGKEGRVPERRAQDVRSELDAGRCLGQGRQQRPRLPGAGPGPR